MPTEFAVGWADKGIKSGDAMISGLLFVKRFLAEILVSGSTEYWFNDKSSWCKCVIKTFLILYPTKDITVFLSSASSRFKVN